MITREKQVFKNFVFRKIHFSKNEFLEDPLSSGGSEICGFSPSDATGDTPGDTSARLGGIRDFIFSNKFIMFSPVTQVTR